MLKMGEYEGYSFSIFSSRGGLALSIQDHNGHDIDLEDELYDTVHTAQLAAEVEIEAAIEGNLLRGARFYPYWQAVEDFKESWEPSVIAHYGRDDTIALRETFNNWTDSLCKDGRIDDSQYNGWDNPY